MDIVSLLLLQPDDQIREQCLIMDPLTLARFTQTNKRIRNICGDILAVHKDKYEKAKQRSELLDLFTTTKHVMFGMKKRNFKEIIILKHSNSIEFLVNLRNEIFDDFLSKVPNIQLPRIQSAAFGHTIRKDLLSDELKLDMLSLVKKLGYTEIYIDDSKSSYIKYKSLNDFSII